MEFTLEETVEAFKEWRKTRRYIGEKIPDALWGMVKALLPIHGRKVLCHTLDINNMQLKRQRIVNDSINEPNSIDGFAMASILSPSICELILHKDSKTITLKLSTTQLPYCLPLIVGAL